MPRWWALSPRETSSFPQSRECHMWPLKLRFQGVGIPPRGWVPSLTAASKVGLIGAWGFFGCVYEMSCVHVGK